MADLFRPGGPHRVRRTGRDTYEMSIDLKPDKDGFLARGCVTDECSPGYFKVKLGTGIAEHHTTAFCPYCRSSDQPGRFSTEEQVKYARSVAMREAHESVSGMLNEALGLGRRGRKKIGGDFLSIEISQKPGRPPRLHYPVEDEVRRDITCPSCGLVHAVFGLAYWCPDCGSDVFVVHVKEEFDVVRRMIEDTERRLEVLGPRVVAKDLENCLEDVVSIFEASMRAMTRRHLKASGLDGASVESQMREVRNSYQNPQRASEVAQRKMGIDLFAPCTENDRQFLSAIFEKRHPITHNLGVIDREYLRRARSGELVGREILVEADEVLAAATLCETVIAVAQASMTSRAENPNKRDEEA